MRNHSQYLAGFGGAAFAVACFLIGLEVSATTAAPSASQTSLTINRTLKSDRMPLDPHEWPQRGEQPGRNECPRGRAGFQAPPARRMRADGERHWAAAAGPDRRTVRLLTLPP